MPEQKPNSQFVHVVAAVIWHPSQVNTLLISKRQKGQHLEYHWELPGGKVDSGEPPVQALNRELLEELDIKVKKSNPFMQVKHRYTDRNILLDVWEVTSFDGKAIGCEGQEICWAPIIELDDFQFPEADIPVLNAIKNSAKA